MLSCLTVDDVEAACKKLQLDTDVESDGEYTVASFLGHSQILSRSHGEKSGEDLVPLLRHELEMVDLVST